MREIIKALQADLRPTLDKLAKKHGLSSLKFEGGSYGLDDFTTKLVGIRTGGKSKEAQRYELNAKLLRLPPLGTVVQQGSHSYKTTGLNTTGSKVYVERIPDGKSFLMSILFVQGKAGAA